MNLTLQASSLKKVFSRRVIFQGISFVLKPGQALRVTGKNGSGKSTLLKILAHVLSPTEGSVIILPESGKLNRPLQSCIGFVSTYLTLYEEFSGRENLELALAIRGLPRNTHFVDQLLDQFSLGGFKDAPARFYSSGMKQRLKYAFALIHRPPILMLDEPIANLDQEGAMVVRHLIAEHRHTGLLVIATNDLSDLDHAEVQVDLNVRT